MVAEKGNGKRECPWRERFGPVVDAPIKILFPQALLVRLNPFECVHIRSKGFGAFIFTVIELPLRMELILNLVWVLLAFSMIGLWLRFAPRGSTGGRVNFTALTVLVLILLPAISITDDLLAAQNPAEVDCCVRRDHERSSSQSIFPSVALPPPPAFAEFWFGAPRMAMCGVYAAPFVESATLTSIQNRPPPIV
jgi:hypothetical protein